MDATVRISDRGPGRSFSIDIKGLDSIPRGSIDRTRIRGLLEDCFETIYREEVAKAEAIFEDECPACGEELKDGKCSDPGCIYNYTEEDK